MTIRLILIGSITLLFFTKCSFNKRTDSTEQGDNPRELRYKPDHGDFVINNGERRFNRALYGSNSGFRVETGDLPEFALYLPGMGGNFQFAITDGDKSKKLIHADEIEARYRPGSMIYHIQDEMLGNHGLITVTVLPFYDAEGMIIRVEGDKIANQIRLQAIYGSLTGKKFSRDGDLGADPESVFYLTPESCSTNEIDHLDNHQFRIRFGEGRELTENERYENDYKLTEAERNAKIIKDQVFIKFPEGEWHIGDASYIDDPKKLWENEGKQFPVLTSVLDFSGQPQYIILARRSGKKALDEDPEDVYTRNEEAREQLAGRIKVHTPDPYINNLGSSLAIAADAVWESPSFLHGAIAWRMPLVGWRGAYVGDWLGWHDRARTHFSSYAASQYTEPGFAPAAPDPEKNLARQIEEKGISIYTSGYLSRRPGKQNSPHHYDMNLVYVDALIRHIHWTGDTAYLKDMWPLLKRHFKWESQNFDPDNDGLYNAYASIWASDALNYNGGVSHSSAYNFYALNWASKMAGDLPNAETYRKKAEQIREALNEKLWMPGKGAFAEYIDNQGNKLLHPNAGIWSVYHLIDSEVPDAFQAWQMLRYVDTEIPHIPIYVKGFDQDDFHTISTTNWMPYTWSVNNVALAEVMHTALAYWQGGVKEEGFKLFKSALMESMYLGATPGNFHQLSSYDAIRGELYRDFSDAVAMTARSLVEGLFGVQPKLQTEKTLYISPGFPAEWNYATLETPDISIDFKKEGNKEVYIIKNKIKNVEKIRLKLIPGGSKLVDLNTGTEHEIFIEKESVGAPAVSVLLPAKAINKIEVEWGGDPVFTIDRFKLPQGADLDVPAQAVEIPEIYDPQDFLEGKDNLVTGKPGFHTAFARINQGDFTWWEPIDIEVLKKVDVDYSFSQPKDKLQIELINNLESDLELKLEINNKMVDTLSIKGKRSMEVELDQNLRTGTNRVNLWDNETNYIFEVVNWDLPNSLDLTPVDLGAYFNDKVSNIFRNEYLSPRPDYPVLQIPIQGMGDWCSYGAYMEIDDSGLRALAGENNTFKTPENLVFHTPSDKEKPNILFTSLWDNYPDSLLVPLSGHASHAWLLMAGSTNPMQSRLENGRVEFLYTDGTSDVLILRNPETWWPIEQDYFEDHRAFEIGAPKPIRVHLKTGWTGRDFNDYVSIDNFTKFGIDGGAATILDVPLNPDKELVSLKLRTCANDVVIGLMAVSLHRP